MNARLVAVAGPLQGAAFPIAPPELTLGRDRANAICLEDLAVSRRHAVITTDGRDTKVSDLGSRNRTTVNGVPVTECLLKDGDQIRIGRSVFVVALRPETEPSGATDDLVIDETIPAAQTVVLGRSDARYLDPSTIARTCSAPGNQATNLECLLQVCEAAGSNRGLEPLATRVFDIAASVIPAERGAILLTGSGTDEFARQVQWRRRGTEQAPVRVPRAIVTRVLEDHVSIRSNDVRAGDAEPSASIIASNVASLLAVPIVLSGRVLGVMYLDTTDVTVRFDADHLQLLTGVAAMAAGGLDGAVHLERVTQDNRRLQAELDIQHDLVGDGPRMQQVYRFIAKVAPSDSTVLIEGESGTGKELVARAIHRNGPRAARPFMAINCATLGETLLESELFGHERGAFTGAIAQKKGKLEEAQGGTVFLDEVGELAPGIQAKLLRVLQQREFERVGGTRTIKADIRLIAATNRTLKDEVKRGSFRQDLYFRLNVVSITMPPLRDRRDDIPKLVSHFLLRHAGKTARRVTGCSPQALRCLQNNDWPGNVRELENAIEHALVLGSAEVILPDDLPEVVAETESGEADPDAKFHERIKQIKKQLVLEALERAGNNYTEAARLLGLHPNNLHRLMRNLRLRSRGADGR